MPQAQADLELETLAEDVPESALVDYPSDCPPESFWLSKDAEFDWFDRNAFLDRKESIKGNSNSTNLISNASSTSAAFLKSKAAIISLPNGQKTSYVDSKRRNCKLANLWLIPKRSDSLGKEPTVAAMAEPSSPKVSCLGRVRSKRCRSRRKSNEPPSKQEKSVTQPEKTNRVQKNGFTNRMKSLFRSDCCGRSKTNHPSLKINQSSECSSPRASNMSRDQEEGRPADPPVLGGAARFSSGRRSETSGTTQILT